MVLNSLHIFRGDLLVYSNVLDQTFQLETISHFPWKLANLIKDRPCSCRPNLFHLAKMLKFNGCDESIRFFFRTPNQINRLYWDQLDTICWILFCRQISLGELIVKQISPLMPLDSSIFISFFKLICLIFPIQWGPFLSRALSDVHVGTMHPKRDS